MDLQDASHEVVCIPITDAYPRPAHRFDSAHYIHLSLPPACLTVMRMRSGRRGLVRKLVVRQAVVNQTAR